MNCVNHPETAATAFCRECGKPMCPDCQRPALGSVFCAEHLPAPAGFNTAGFNTAGFNTPGFTPPRAAPIQPPPPSTPGSPYTSQYARRAEGIHPAIAFILGFAPGVGAICNGQYAKGLVHAVIFGTLVSVVSHGNNHGMEPLLGILIAAWVFYQAFEAFHTARKRRYGIAVEEFSSLLDFRTVHGRLPGGAIALIGLGFILLLNSTEIIPIRFFTRFWPGLLIFFGIYLLYNRSNPSPQNSVPPLPSDPWQNPPNDGSFRR